MLPTSVSFTSRRKADVSHVPHDLVAAHDEDDAGEAETVEFHRPAEKENVGREKPPVEQRRQFEVAPPHVHAHQNAGSRRSLAIASSHVTCEFRARSRDATQHVARRFRDLRPEAELSANVGGVIDEVFPRLQKTVNVNALLGRQFEESDVNIWRRFQRVCDSSWSCQNVANRIRN